MNVRCSLYHDSLIQDDTLIVHLGKQMMLQYIDLQEVSSSFTFASRSFLASFTWRR